MTREDQIFYDRLWSKYDELRWLYMELYGNEAAFDYFRSMLYKAYCSRDPYLRMMDEAREAHPEWYRDRDMLGALMYVQCFGKNLKGVRKRLDYIEQSGVNYIHYMPLLQSPKGRSDGGYAVSDFRAVEPELGTMEELAELNADCHKRGISVCLDFVMNHTSEDHEWAIRAKAGDPEYQRRYFFFDNWDIPNEFEKTMPQVFPQTAPGNFSWCPEAGKVVMTTFWPYQCDLNYGNPVVFNEMTDNMLYLCNQGVDIIRLDATPYIWKELYTSCRNLPKVHTLVRMMRLACEIVCPGTLLLGEIVMEPSKVVPYFGTVEKPECHMLYNVTTMASTWHTVATSDVRLLRHQMEAVFALPKQYTFLNYLRCHDDIGWGLDYAFLKPFGVDEVSHKKYLNDWFTGKYPGSLSRGELYNDDPRLGDARMCGTTASLCGVEGAEETGDKAALELALRLDETLHAFLLTQSGIPVLYSGDEIAQLNDNGYRNDPLKVEDSRYIHRGDFSWEDAEKKDDPATRQGRIYQFLRTIETLRADHPVFDPDADVWTMEPLNDHVLAIGRYYRKEKLLALFNFSQIEQSAWLNEPETYVDLMTGKPRSDLKVDLPGYGFAWLYTKLD